MVDGIVGKVISRVDRLTSETAVGAKVRPSLVRACRAVGFDPRRYAPVANPAPAAAPQDGSAVPAAAAAEAVPPVDDDALANPVYANLLNELTGAGDDPDLVRPILKDWEQKGVAYERPEALKNLLPLHEKPHLANYVLSMWEMQNKVEHVSSLPMAMSMDLSSLCNVQCKFCKYTHKFLPSEFLSVEHIKSIEWFPYVRWFNFSAGTAESIIHPKFIEIFDYVRDTYPHLHLSILTNGRALREDRLQAFKDRLDVLYVSMNAANKEDYEAIIEGGNWDQFDANMKSLKRILGDSDKTHVQAHFVLMRWNLDRALDYMDYAVEHGAKHVMFSHFYPHYVADLHKSNQKVLSGKFTFKDSLYFEKERADEMFDRLEARAEELGVSVYLPPRFRDSSNIYFGVRSQAEAPTECSDPWTKLFLLWGWKSRREEATLCCGLASDIGVYFDRDDVASTEGLRALWNSPTLQAYRRSANGADQNPICSKCRSVDRFDPSGYYPDQRDFFRYNKLPIPPHFFDEGEVVDQKHVQDAGH